MAQEHPSVTLFRDYLRIKTVQPDPDYDTCMVFLAKIAKELDLPFQILEPVKGKPVFLMTWEGTHPDWPSVLLNSHTDVVPVFPECWKYDPFEAVKDEKGDIYARGTQDMKSVGIQHIEAIRRLKEKGIRLKRTIHLCFIADEELGGHEGMAKFVLDKKFKELNIEFALDEGLASPDEVVPVFYGERNVFWIKFHCKGNPGHGSRFIENTAGAKVQYLINKLLAFREEQRRIFVADETLTLGDVTTVNLTMMSGGVQMNVVPNELTIGFDIRVTPTTNMEQFQGLINQWIEEAGGDIEPEYVQRFTDQTLTSVAEDFDWYKALKRATNKHDLKISPRIFPAGTDSRYLRELGISALGFSPMNNTPVLLHDHNEFLNETIFLKGIDIFEDIITEIGNVEHPAKNQ